MSTILGNIYNDITRMFVFNTSAVDPVVSYNLISLLGVAAGGITVYTGLLKIKDAQEKPDELKKGLIYIGVGALMSGFIAFNEMAGITFFGGSTSLTNMGWGEASQAPNQIKEALKFSVMVIRLVGVYCFASSLSSIKTFAHNQDHAAFNTAKVRFFSAVLLVNFPLFVRTLAGTMGGDIGGKILTWFPA